MNKPNIQIVTRQEFILRLPPTSPTIVLREDGEVNQRMGKVNPHMGAETRFIQAPHEAKHCYVLYGQYW